MPRVLPPRPFAGALLVRVSVIWLCLHVAMASGSAYVGVPFPQLFVGTPVTAIWSTAATVLVLRVVMARERELVFLGNLGYAFHHLVPAAVAECVALDLGLRLALG